MKGRRGVSLQLAERFDIPLDALPGAVRLAVTEGERALIENHRGILELGETCIIVGAGTGQIRVLGSGLQLLAMNRRELLIGGRIQGVEWG